VAKVTVPRDGTAFAISADKALTAFHCIADGAAPLGETVDRSRALRAVDGVELVFKPTSIPIPDERVTAKVVDGDSVRDWAVLELDRTISAQWRLIPIRASELIGRPWLVQGYPWRIQEEVTGPLTDEVVATGETMREGSPVVILRAPMIGHTIDARGMSGGPVLTRNGQEAVGLVTARLMQDGEQAGGVLFACAATVFAQLASLEPRLEPAPQAPETDQDALADAEASAINAAAQFGTLLQTHGDVERATPWLHEAAEGGDAAAAYFVGMSIDPDGQVFRQDPERADEALAWFRKAATGGDVYGMTTLGIRLRQRGRDDAALPWLEEAAERGTDAMAMHTLGLIYADRGDAATAERYERLAAERGDVAAAYNLGRRLLDRGENDQAIKWLDVASDDPLAADLLRSLGGQPGK
jgi:TPR repeat protein